MKTLDKNEIIAAALTDQVKKLAKRHTVCCEELCNYPDDDGRIEKRMAGLEGQLMAIARCFPLYRTISFQYDPRGHTVKIEMTDGSKVSF